MRFEQYLQEKYVGSTKASRGHGGACSIYVNPTKMELGFAHEESNFIAIRFIADNLNKKVFVWSFNFIHVDIWDNFLVKTFGKGRNKYFKASDLLPGTATKKGSKFVMDDSDEILHQQHVGTLDWIDGILDIDWKWADKYVEVTPWVNNLTKDIKRIHDRDQKHKERDSKNI